MNAKILREAQLLSGLNHESVVRYYHSWKESQESPDLPKRPRTKSGLERKESLTNDSLLKLNNFQFKSLKSVTWAEDDWSENYSESETEETEKSSSESDSDDPESEPTQTENFIESESSESTENLTVTKQYLFVVMEFCSNRTLKDEIYNNAERLSSDRAWTLFREILEGLDYIHSNKTIHRDLKPGNIFLDSAFRAKIGDFGLALEKRQKENHVGQKWGRKMSVRSKSETEQSFAAGTPLYIVRVQNRQESKLLPNNRI